MHGEKKERRLPGKMFKADIGPVRRRI